jgi:hypothetical protein
MLVVPFRKFLSKESKGLSGKCSSSARTNWYLASAFPLQHRQEEFPGSTEIEISSTCNPSGQRPVNPPIRPKDVRSTRRSARGEQPPRGSSKKIAPHTSIRVFRQSKLRVANGSSRGGTRPLIAKQRAKEQAPRPDPQLRQ